VLRLVASGLTNKEVAARLYLSVETVKAHLETIYRKLDASDRTHAVAVALREGLLE
jgi:DNA-binding NarL/FixJ family response regulator